METMLVLYLVHSIWMKLTISACTKSSMENHVLFVRLIRFVQTCFNRRFARWLLLWMNAGYGLFVKFLIDSFPDVVISGIMFDDILLSILRIRIFLVSTIFWEWSKTHLHSFSRRFMIHGFLCLLRLPLNTKFWSCIVVVFFCLVHGDLIRISQLGI